ncbi:MAG: serine hydrolase [Ferruginibacter sp.]
MSRILMLFFFSASFVSPALGQPITSRQIDSVSNLVLKTFNVPGIAVAVIKDNKVIHAKGYGVRSLATMQPVDENTLYGIASNSKAFTTTALAMLVDEKKISWDDKVTDYIPEFRMYDRYVTEQFTIRDLLTHRSGLGLGAGDLMFWPDSSSFTKQDMIRNLRYLKATSAFRTKYDYDNNLYMVAGEVLARVTGMSWENFIQTRILDPLGMTMTAPSFKLLKNKSNVTEPHAPVDGTVKVIRRDWNENANAAGGIYSNLTDLSKWVIMHLNDGKYGSNFEKRLISADTHKDLWAPQTIIEVGGPGTYNTHFAAYGLGFFLNDSKGYKQVSHTGGLAGIVTQVTMIPELNLGIIVFTNQQQGAAFTAITNTIKDAYFGMPPVNRIKEYHDRVVANEASAEKITSGIWEEIRLAQKNTQPVNADKVLGTYHDKWFGDVTIVRKNGKLWFTAQKSFLLNGELTPYKGNTWVVKWGERSLDADAFVMFNESAEGKIERMTMKAISPLTDFSFDFQDLDFEKIN